MKFIETPLPGAYEIELEPVRDERGSFARTFCEREFSRIGFRRHIVQINHSMTSKKGTIRGIHYQLPPAAEGKIIRCVHGKVFDVVVDFRAGSPTFLQWHGVELSHKNMRTVCIPEGFGHGFQALTDDVEMIYHHSEFYNAEHECGVRFDDPALAIKWPLRAATVSQKDRGYRFIGEEFTGVAP